MLEVLGDRAAALRAGLAGLDSHNSLGRRITIVPTVAVTDNAPIAAGSTLTFTATVTAPTGDPTPTGAMGWAITPPGGGSTPCSSSTGPTGSSNVATYTCSISSAADGNYSATANYPGDSTYAAASGSDPTAQAYTSPTFDGVGTATTWTTTGSAKAVAYPSAAVSGDLLLLMIANSNDNNTIACPSGWTQSGTTSTATGDNAYLESCYKFKTTDTSVSITAPSGFWTAEVAAFSGVNVTTSLDNVTPVYSVSGAGSTTFAPTGLTTNTAGDLAVSIVMENDAASTVPTLTLSTANGFTGATSEGFSSIPSNAENFAYEEITTPGAVTFPTWTTNTHTNGTNGSIWLGISIALGSS